MCKFPVAYNCYYRQDNSFEKEVNYFGVYEIHEDGTEHWIGDFPRYGDAQMFALEKEKEKWPAS